MLDREPRRVRRHLRVAGSPVALLAFALVAAPAFAQPPPITYPGSRALPEVAAWLQRDTPLLLGQVVDVGPSAVTAITSVSPMGQPRGFLARAASEALAPQIIADEGVASWSIPVEVDCEQRLVRLGEMTGYKTRDLKTDGKIVREPNPEWVRPIPSAPLGAVIAALCDRDFKRPFAAKRYAALGKSTPAAPAPTRLAEAAPPPLRAAITPKPQKPEPAPKPETPAKAETAKAEPVKSEGPKGGGSVAVQIGASPSKPDIEALLAKFRKTHGAELGGLSTDVATVESDGKTVNRALIKGFASNAEAGAFCKRLEASGQACFIRH
ncbi:MAG: SPOR domain-containing protein [Proteobacteria bacterium]|nr:SPOR domain-containing protein [Pseudomonadota bacterium]